ncbi:hypothetical protein LCGC14_3119610, partial [marine sediment metagenome]
SEEGQNASLAYQVGVALKRRHGHWHGAALFPIPGWTPTGGYSIDRALIFAYMRQESNFKTGAKSSAGARGLMQLMPATAARFGVTDRSDAPQNIRGGVTYLNWLMGEFDNDPLLALAGYNAGEGAVRKYAGVPPYSETRAYIPKVLAAWSVARGLCLTPPQFVTDGCVFLGQGAATRG